MYDVDEIRYCHCRINPFAYYRLWFQQYNRSLVLTFLTVNSCIIRVNLDLKFHFLFTNGKEHVESCGWSILMEVRKSTTGESGYVKFPTRWYPTTQTCSCAFSRHTTKEERRGEEKERKDTSSPKSFRASLRRSFCLIYYFPRTWLHLILFPGEQSFKRPSLLPYLPTLRRMRTHHPRCEAAWLDLLVPGGAFTTTVVP